MSQEMMLPQPYYYYYINIMFIRKPLLNEKNQI